MKSKIIDAKDFPTALKIAQKEILKNREPKTMQEAVNIITHALAILVISKNAKYGKENVLAFREQGVFIRLWDKIQRLKNKLFNNADLGEETELDSWGDVSGYGIVGLLLQKGWFELPIEGLRK